MTTIRSAAYTDRGRVRQSNEDAHLAWDQYQVYAVADGMGGHAGGEVAASKAIETLAESVRRDNGADVFKRAHEAILDHAYRHPGLAGMGTTLTVLQLLSRTSQHLPLIARIGHVGDSRCYRVRHGSCEQLTRDHSVRHMLHNCLGHRPDSFSNADFVTRSARPGDVFVLATDGLNYGADAERIGAVVREDRTLYATAASFAERVARALVHTALEAGGPDNVTVVVVEVV